MIIEPGLPDHWKVKELKRLSGRSDAVEWLIRLWGACQTRKSTWYDADKPSVISSTCCFDGDPNQFVEWLLNVGVLEKETHRLTQSQNGLTQNGVGLLAVHDWEKHNAKYVANWKNGEKGGRPADQPPEPKKTQLEIGVHRRKEGIEGIERTEGERRVAAAPTHSTKVVFDEDKEEDFPVTFSFGIRCTWGRPRRLRARLPRTIPNLAGWQLVGSEGQPDLGLEEQANHFHHEPLDAERQEIRSYGRQKTGRTLLLKNEHTRLVTIFRGCRARPASLHVAAQCPRNLYGASGARVLRSSAHNCVPSVARNAGEGNPD